MIEGPAKLISFPCFFFSFFFFTPPFHRGLLSPKQTKIVTVYLQFTHSFNPRPKLAKPYLSINLQSVSSCGDHSWCCQSVTADAPYCCTGKDKFTTYNVNENQFVIPAFPSSSNSSSSYSISKPTSQASSNGKNKSQTIALAVGLGIPLAVALAAGLFFYLILRCRRARGRLLSTSASSGDSGGHTEAVEIDFSVTTSSSPVIAEVSGERKYELPVERDIPPAEFYVKPV